MAEYNCPTGECGHDEKDCHAIEEGDEIGPNSKAHLERNACNRCPSSPPKPYYQIHRISRGRGQYDTVKLLLYYYDDEDHKWAPDNALTAW